MANGCGGDDTVGLASGQEPDPVAVDFSIGYTKRSVPMDDNGSPAVWDARDLAVFEPGAALYIRDRASPSAPERRLVPEEDNLDYDIRDLQVSYDAEKLVFSMRGPFDPDVGEEEQPTWNIWEYEIASQTLRRLIASDLTAEAGHDRMPHYLPDGRIVFTSTRQRRTVAVLLDEGRPQYPALTENGTSPAFVLHVMEADGSGIRQISFNQSHDLYPAVLGDGSIVFTRWEDMPGRDGMQLYRVRPDGTQMELLYGANSHDTGSGGDPVQFLRALPAPDGRLLTRLAPFAPANFGGDLVAIDANNFLEMQQSIADSNDTGPGQVPATVNAVLTDDRASPGGRFTAGWPLWDGTDRLLVNWTQCRLAENGRIVPCTDSRLAEPGAVPAMPLYGVWIYDPVTATQLPIVVPEEGEMIDEAVAARPRPAPPVLFDQTPATGLDSDLAEAGLGLIDIRSIYDIAGVDTADPDTATMADPAMTDARDRRARFLRISRLVPQPDDDVRDVPNIAFGRNRAFGMREIVAYAPIEPDGSVRIEVPADLPLTLAVLDARARRIGPRHRSWLQVRPGETVQCLGCHDSGSELSHGRAGAFESAWPGAPTTGLPFPNTDPELFAVFGETMAQLRTRVSCETDCAARRPSLDVVYEDVWTDEATAGRPPDASFAYRYSDLDTEKPVSPACLTEWSANCRAIINYEQHIHPLWTLDRRIFDTDDMTLLDDHTCISCHTPTGDMNEPQVPAGQLDLTDGQSPDRPAHFNSYRELAFDDNEQEVVMGALQDRLVEIGIDPDTGEPILGPVIVPPSIRGSSANASRDFANRFLRGGDHDDYLSDAELRLIFEWIDLGALYYNDPFAAPES